MQMPDGSGYYADHSSHALLSLCKSIERYPAALKKELCSRTDPGQGAYVESILSQKACELEERFAHEDSVEIRNALNCALDDFTECCLKLNPKGYFSGKLKLGVIGHHHEGAGSERRYVARCIERQLRPAAYNEERLLQRDVERRRPSASNSVMCEELREEYEHAVSTMNRRMHENTLRLNSMQCMICAAEPIPIGTLIGFFYERINREDAIKSGRLIRTFYTVELHAQDFTECIEYAWGHRN